MTIEVETLLELANEKLKTREGLDAMTGLAFQYLKNILGESLFGQGHRRGGAPDRMVQLILAKLKDEPKRQGMFDQLSIAYRRVCDLADERARNACAHRRTPRGLCTDCGNAS
jgi:hypothetical protein